MNNSLKCVFGLIFALYFGWLAIQSLQSNVACSFVHPFLDTSESSGCIGRYDSSFVYWKRVGMYLIFSFGGLYLGAASLGKPRVEEE